MILALESYGLGVNLFLIFHHYVLTFLAKIWLSYQVVQRPVYATAQQPLLGEGGNPKPQPRPSTGLFPMKDTTTYLTLLQTNCYHYQARQLCFFSVLKEFGYLFRNFTAGKELRLNGATLVEFCSEPLVHWFPGPNNSCPGVTHRPGQIQPRLHSRLTATQ